MRRSLLCLSLLVLCPASAAALVRLEVATVDAEAGARAKVDVRLLADGGEDVATVGNDISFDPASVRIATAMDGGGDCAVESGIPYFLAAFLFLPQGCNAAAGTCTGVRAVVLQFELDEVPVSGRTLYHCNVEVQPSAPPGLYVLPNTNASWSTSEGVERPLQTVAGVVVVARDRLPSTTPTPPLPTPSTPPPVLDPACTGDCDASGEVDDAEQSGVLEALFDTAAFAACAGSTPQIPLSVTAANLLRAVRAHVEGCAPAAAPTPTLTATLTATLPPPTTTLAPTRTAAVTAIDTPTSTPRATRTSARSPTPTRTPRRTATPTRTRARTPSATPTPTRVPRTATPTPQFGPQVTFLGVARGDGRLVQTSGEIDGTPIYELASGSGFHLVVEGRPGAELSAVGQTTDGAAEAPDLQMLVSQPLGDGSARVCSGGVPAHEPALFDDSDAVVDALNDLGCHFDLGPCVLFGDGRRGLVAPQSTIQFCGLVGLLQRFSRGDTFVSVRLRDRNRVTGEVSRMVVRIGSF